jgi:hypothetical protein
MSTKMAEDRKGQGEMVAKLPTHQESKKKATRATVDSAAIEQPKELLICLEIQATPGIGLIQNCFSQKTVEELLRKHMGLTVQREKKIPSDCIERATERNTEGAVSIPPTALKKAMLTAAGMVKGLKKTVLRIAAYVEGGSIPITYSRMVPRMDVVRTSGMNRVPDIRFRPMFEDWKARVVIVFGDVLDAQSIVDLVNRAGRVGLMEWRAEKGGTFGTFFVSRLITDPAEIKEVQRLCRPPIKPLIIPEWAINEEISPDLLEKIAKSNSDEAEPDETN